PFPVVEHPLRAPWRGRRAPPDFSDYPSECWKAFGYPLAVIGPLTTSCPNDIISGISHFLFHSLSVPILLSSLHTAPTNANILQQTATNTNSWVSVRQQLVFVGHCRVLSEEFNITCSVGLGKVAECLPNEHSDSSQLGSTRVHNILELSWMSLLCWLSASLLKKNDILSLFIDLPYGIGSPNKRVSRRDT